MLEHKELFTKNKLLPLIDTWPKVRDILGVEGFDVIYMVEKTFDILGLKLYLPDGDTGLWKANRPDKYWLRQLGTSDFAQAFANGRDTKSGGWGNWRVTPADFDKIINYAHTIADNAPEGYPAKREGYPDELRAAIEAFEAVRGNPAATAKRTPKAALAAWLESNKPELSANARERIATVANWQPAGGAPKTPGE